MPQMTGLHEGGEATSYAGVGSVTPSDTVPVGTITRAIRATTAGTIKITSPDGDTPTCAFTAGETRTLRATLIWATGTTATGIEMMY